MFDLTGFIYQVTGVMFEATRLVMIQMILSSPDFKMDPLVSLYYYAPVCAVMNAVVSVFTELPTFHLDDIYRVGIITLIANAMVAFLLNVSLVFLVRYLCSQIMRVTNMFLDRQNFFPRSNTLRCPKGHSSGCSFHDHLGHACQRTSILWLQYCFRWSSVLQARQRAA